MAAPTRPESTGQPGSGRVIPRSGSSSPTTPQTSGQQAPSTDGNTQAQTGASVTSPTAPQQPTREQQLLAAQEALLREQAQELARLRQGQRQIESRVQQIEQPAAPQPTREQLNERFWRDPMLIVDTIRDELRRTVDPINQAIQGQRTESEYDKMKAKLQIEYGDDWQHIEGYVDRFVEQAAAAGNPINDQLVDVAALSAYGALRKGRLGLETSGADPVTSPAPTPPAAAPTQQQSQSVRTEMLPPHLRPSAPSSPTGQQPRTERRELTENEARLARERGMSKEQFLDWLEVPPDQVVHSQIGRPAR